MRPRNSFARPAGKNQDVTRRLVRREGRTQRRNRGVGFGGEAEKNLVLNEALMLDEERPVATHPLATAPRNAGVDRVKAALVLAAALASVLVTLVAARSFALLPH